MPHDFSCTAPAFPRTNGFTVDRPLPGSTPESPEFRFHLVEDFTRAQQATVMLDHGSSAHRHTAVAQPVPRESRNELALVVRRATNLPPSRGAFPMRPLSLATPDSRPPAEQIYSMLRDEIAIPALRRFERVHHGEVSRGKSASHVFGHPARSQSAWTPPWFDDLLPHLRIEAQLLAQRGLTVDKVRHRLDVLFRHEHPGISWRAMRTGLERDALPFAVGATVLSVLADAVDPQRRLSAMWPPVEALGVVLINLIGMARFNAAHPELASRLSRVTPTQALEAVSMMLRNPVRDVAAHVIGFVFCYGVVRNLARLGAEAGLSAVLPGIMAHRFGNTIHSCLEILLCPIPGALLGPIIDRMAIAPEDARLEPLLQDRFADLICKMSDDLPCESTRPFWRAFLTHFTGLLQSGAPKAIWVTLSLGFYFLSTLHNESPVTDHDDAMFEAATQSAANVTTVMPQTGEPGQTSSIGIDWHTQAVLSVLYGLIATFVSMQGIASRHEAIATAYTRRRGRPKISTVTVTSQGDSGHSSTGSQSDFPDSPVGTADTPERNFPHTPGHPAGVDPRTPSSDASADNAADNSGDTSGDDSVSLPMGDALPISLGGITGRMRPADSPQGRKHGTSVAPADIALEPTREGGGDVDCVTRL